MQLRGINYDTGFGGAVAWTDFDFAAVDLYRSAANAADFPEHVRNHAGHGKPLVITEFGCCTYRGAADAGGLGWTIVDFTAEPRALNGGYVRDEAGQAAYFSKLMDVFEAEGVHGAVRMLDRQRWEPKEIFHAIAARYGTAPNVRSR